MHGPERPVDETVTILLQVQLSHRPGGLVPCENFTSPRFSSTGKSGLRAVMLSPCLLAGRGAVHGRYFLWSFLNNRTPGSLPPAWHTGCTARPRAGASAATGERPKGRRSVLKPLKLTGKHWVGRRAPLGRGPPDCGERCPALCECSASRPVARRGQRRPEAGPCQMVFSEPMTCMHNSGQACTARLPAPRPLQVNKVRETLRR